MRIEDRDDNVLDLAFFRRMEDKTIRKGVPVRTPTEIERRGTTRATAGEIIVDVLALGGFLLLLYLSARYLR